MKSIVVFSDRDGTINLDENYYLGSSSEWKKQIQFLEGVVDGIRLINTIPNSYFFILTNQSGVALQGGELDNLTEDRMHEVNSYIISLLTVEGLKIDGYFACPFVDSKYAKKAEKKGRVVDSRYVVEEHEDMKPNIGMINKALNAVNLQRENCEVFMIGDRASDVEMGLKAGGTGILVESCKTKELGDIDKVQQLKGPVCVAPNFLEACKIIKNKTR